MNVVSVGRLFDAITDAGWRSPAILFRWHACPSCRWVGFSSTAKDRRPIVPKHHRPVEADQPTLW